MPTEKEFDDFILQTAEQINKIQDSLSRLAASVGTLQAAVAALMNPTEPLQALKQIQEMEENLLKRDPGAAKRKERHDAFEALKLIEKYGGPKQA